MKPSRHIPELPLKAPPQARSYRREDEATYQAVLALRRLGLQVYRAGCNHSLVDGRRMHNTRLRREVLIRETPISSGKKCE